MKSTAEAHRAHPWRVQTLCPDFELLDVWRFEVELDERRGFDAFLEVYWQALRAVEHSALSRMRVRLGKWFGWDEEVALPIPGCTETSVAERMTADDRARNRLGANAESPIAVPGVRHVYRFDDEMLVEVTNETVHALMHVSGAKGEKPMLAVYIKSRGPMTRVYMAAISPARHWVIYPMLMKRVEALWKAKYGSSDETIVATAAGDARGVQPRA